MLNGLTMLSIEMLKKDYFREIEVNKNDKLKEVVEKVK